MREFAVLIAVPDHYELGEVEELVERALDFEVLEVEEQ